MAIKDAVSRINNKKTGIWTNDATYLRYFHTQTTGAHLVFAFSLLRAVEATKTSLYQKSKTGVALKQTEQTQLQFFRSPGAIFVLVAAIAKSLETILDQAVPDRFSLSFGTKITPKKAIDRWDPVIFVTLPFTNSLFDSSDTGMRSQDIEARITRFANMVEATATPNRIDFSRFAKQVKHAKFT